MSDSRGATMEDKVLQDNLETPRRFLGLRLAQTAGLVDDALELLDFDRRRQRETWELTKQCLPGGAGQAVDEAEDDMPGGRSIIVGDVTIYSDRSAEIAQSLVNPGDKATPQPAPAPAPTDDPPIEVDKPAPAPTPSPIEVIKQHLPDLKPIPTWAKAALVAAALGGVGGVGYLSALAIHNFNSTPAAQEFEDTFGTGEFIDMNGKPKGK